MVMTICKQNIKVKGLAVQKLEWKNMNKQTDITDRITFLATVVSNNAQVHLADITDMARLCDQSLIPTET